KNFVRGSKDHAVMAAELRAGRPVRGWILQPEHDVAYVAEAGSGVYRNGQRMEPVARTSDTAGLRGVSSSKLNGTAPQPLPQITDSWWCAGVDYAQLLQGRIDYL